MQTLKRCAALCLMFLVILLACKKSPVETISLKKRPVANAGPDQVVKLPNNFTQLVGSATDADGSIVSYQWESLLDNPGPHTLITPAQPVTNLTDLELGEYVFYLTVIDNDGYSSTDDVMILVVDSLDYPWNY